MFFFCITEITEMLPGILNQLGADNLANLKKLASTVAGCKLTSMYLSLSMGMILMPTHQTGDLIT